MKYIILLSIFFFQGCYDRRIILIPSTEYYPTFRTTDFNPQESMYLDITDENNIIYIDKPLFLKYIEYNKNNRSDYNVLLNKVNEFNERINELNQIQNSKKPQEIK